MPPKYTIIPPVVKGKKYSVLKDGKYLLSFGSSAHEQYKDVTGLGLWTHKDHLDKERRRRYYARHGKATNKDSAKWWSHHYLWPNKNL